MNRHPQESTARGSTQTTQPTPYRAERAAVAYRRAWWSLALYPASFLAAFGIGEGLFTLIAHDTADPSVGQVLASSVPALLVFVVPGVLAARYGRTAVLNGRRAGWAPVVIGSVIGLGFIALNAAAYFLGG